MKKKSHLLKLLKMDLHRCIGAKRFPVIIALIVVLLIANVWESVMIELQYKMRMMGSLEKLMELLIFDRFKAAVIVLLSAVYTFGLCDDRNSSYDRLILFRCRPGEYLLSKLISNAIGVVSAVCISFVIFSIVLLPIMPLVGGDGMTQYFGYFACAMNCSGVQVLNVNGFAVNYFYAIGIMLLFCMVPWCLCFWAMKRRKHEGWI